MLCFFFRNVLVGRHGPFPLPSNLHRSCALWQLRARGHAALRIEGSNQGDALKQAALLGAGISMHPHYMVSEELRAGTLEALLPGCVPEETDINVVFSTRRNMPTRVRHLLEFLKGGPSTARMGHAGRRSRKVPGPRISRCQDSVRPADARKDERLNPCSRRLRSSIWQP